MALTLSLSLSLSFSPSLSVSVFLSVSLPLSLVAVGHVKNYLLVALPKFCTLFLSCLIERRSLLPRCVLCCYLKVGSRLCVQCLMTMISTASQMMQGCKGFRHLWR